MFNKEFTNPVDIIKLILEYLEFDYDEQSFDEVELYCYRNNIYAMDFEPSDDDPVGDLEKILDVIDVYDLGLDEDEMMAVFELNKCPCCGGSIGDNYIN